MSFQIYYLDTRGNKKHVRIDRASEQEAIQSFKDYHPRFKIVRVVDVTNLVRNLGLSCY